MKKLVLSVLGVLVGVAAAPALAVTSFSLENPTCANAGSGTSSCVFGNGVTLSAVGTADQLGTSTLSSISIEYYGNNSGSYGSSAGGGWGAWTGSDPNAPYHAVDNNGKYEMLLLTFTQKVSLTSMQIGWNGTDNAGLGSDMSVLAFTGGNGDPRPFPGAGDTWNSLTQTWNSTSNTGGWKTVGNYLSVGSQANNTQDIQTINQQTKNSQTQATSEIFSSYWLIGAYNAAATGGSLANLSPSDTIKLLGVMACTESETNAGASGCVRPPGRVPEPGSLALFGLAFAGVGLVRRRSTRR